MSKNKSLSAQNFSNNNLSNIFQQLQHILSGIVEIEQSTEHSGNDTPTLLEEDEDLAATALDSSETIISTNSFTLDLEFLEPILNRDKEISLQEFQAILKNIIEGLKVNLLIALPPQIIEGLRNLYTQIDEINREVANEFLEIIKLAENPNSHFSTSLSLSNSNNLIRILPSNNEAPQVEVIEVDVMHMGDIAFFSSCFSL